MGEKHPRWTPGSAGNEATQTLLPSVGRSVDFGRGRKVGDAIQFEPDRPHVQAVPTMLAGGHDMAMKRVTVRPVTHYAKSPEEAAKSGLTVLPDPESNEQMRLATGSKQQIHPTDKGKAKAIDKIWDEEPDGKARLG
eukprot:gene43142-26596_t